MTSMLLLAISLALGQEVQPLTLDELLQSLDGRHPQIAVAVADQSAAQAKQRAALGAYDLRLEADAKAQPLGEYNYGSADAALSQLTPLWGTKLSAGWSYGYGDIPSYYEYLKTDPSGEVWAKVAVPLLQDGAIDSARATRRSADLGLDAAEASVRALEIGVTRASTLAYWRWVYAGQRLALFRELLDLARARDSAIASRVAQGDLPALERLDNQRIILEREARVTDAERSLAQARLDLGLYLRDAEGRTMPPGPERLPSELPAPVDPDEAFLGDLLAQALSARPELWILDARLAQARIELALSRNQLLPTLDVNGMVVQGMQGSPVELVAGLNFMLPLQRRAASGDLGEAEALVARLEAERRWQVDRITAEVERARVGLEAAYVRWQAASRSVELALALEQAEQTRFDLGDSDLLRVYQREQIFADAAIAELDARLEFHTAVAELRAALAS